MDRWVTGQGEGKVLGAHLGQTLAANLLGKSGANASCGLSTYLLYVTPCILTGAIHETGHALYEQGRNLVGLRCAYPHATYPKLTYIRCLPSHSMHSDLLISETSLTPQVNIHLSNVLIHSQAYDGLPVNSALSMGVHESQSLLWERMVGLSLPFAKYLRVSLRLVYVLKVLDTQVSTHILY